MKLKFSSYCTYSCSSIYIRRYIICVCVCVCMSILLGFTPYNSVSPVNQPYLSIEVRHFAKLCFDLIIVVIDSPISVACLRVSASHQRFACGERVVISSYPQAVATSTELFWKRTIPQFVVDLLFFLNGSQLDMQLLSCGQLWSYLKCLPTYHFFSTPI